MVRATTTSAITACTAHLNAGPIAGRGIFLAETSATCGGLDSLLEPHGTIKSAQELAAKAFGADRSFWVTNGTSTANKIVVQGLVRPGDIVLVDRYGYCAYFCILGLPSFYLYLSLLCRLQELPQVPPPGFGARGRLCRLS